MKPTEPPPVQVRPAVPDDLATIVEVHLSSRRAAPMPPSVHEDHEAHAWLAGRMQSDEVWVAEVDDVVVAYLRMTETWLDDLYVAPDRLGLGIGGMLLDVAKARRPRGFSLWVFEMNLPARSFYLRHGLVEREHTDGRDNEEKVPDLRMSWL